VGDFALFFLFDNGVSVRESGKEVKGWGRERWNGCGDG
jgi:hypothetical protein